jgi:hypothetical protein
LGTFLNQSVPVANSAASLDFKFPGDVISGSCARAEPAVVKLQRS